MNADHVFCVFLGFGIGFLFAQLLDLVPWWLL